MLILSTTRHSLPSLLSGSAPSNVMDDASTLLAVSSVMQATDATRSEYTRSNVIASAFLSINECCSSRPTKVYWYVLYLF